MTTLDHLLTQEYGLTPLALEKSSVGAGSDTYFVTCQEGKYVLKFPASSEMNRPELEAELCDFLLQKGLPVSAFLKNRSGSFLTCDQSGRVCHVQRFVEGQTHELNTAPDWLMDAQAEMLGRIHAALKGYQGLPVGIGESFFQFMTPQNALKSYQSTLNSAMARGDEAMAADLRYRIGLMERFPSYTFDMDRLTCQATHGDYFLSQLLCGEGQINAVIDWTTACVHPVVWEIMRSYAYAAPCCARGEIDIDGLCAYIKRYMAFAPLTKYDLAMLGRLFYDQIAVCDYYGQYENSTADNREIYLHQAVFSTRLLKWFEKNIDQLEKALADIG